ncbi:MAG: NUDIX hydrolase [candidate division WWE3 bacterium]|nr:NUDIX hydrolase [candidate division WWE3 bacterium]
MNNITIVCRALIIDNNKGVLLVKKTGSDFWSLPGGKLDTQDSSLQDCLKRELQEELGTQIKIEAIHFVQELHKEDTRYVELIWQAALEINLSLQDIQKTSNGELDGIRWVSQSELRSTNVKPDFLKELTL